MPYGSCAGAGQTKRVIEQRISIAGRSAGQVVLANGVERDVLGQDQFVVALPAPCQRRPVSVFGM